MAKFKIVITKPSGQAITYVHTVVGAARNIVRLCNECNYNAEYYRSINYVVEIIALGAVISRCYFNRLTKQFQISTI